MPITQPPALSAGRLASLARGSAGVLLLLGLLGAWWQMGALWQASVHAAEPAVVIPAPAVDAPKESSKPAAPGLQTVVLAGGCFWGVQAVFQHVKGVTQAVSGYAGGSKETAIYEVVTSGRTGHAESVQVTYDPRQITYGRILQIYFSVAHDPTQLNRQGPDTGTQYRSAIFYRDDSQKSIAQAYVTQLDKAGVFKRPIVTQINQLTEFYPAEAYHQDYATLHPTSPYIAYNDLPKVENLQHVFADIYRDRPVLVSAANQSN
jgi:peptide-methionine (S)-S-oxide reductase